MQLKYLENYFSNNSYLSRDERTVLAKALDMTELQIRNWFQNKRYQKRHKPATTTTTITNTGSATNEEKPAEIAFESSSKDLQESRESLTKTTERNTETIEVKSNASKAELEDSKSQSAS